MKSAETRKKRNRSFKSLKSSRSLKKQKDVLGNDKKQEFYDKITEFVEGALNLFGDISQGFTTTTEINKDEVVVSVNFEYYELFRIHIKTKFLKIESVLIEDVDFTDFKKMTEESEGTRAYILLNSNERKFKTAINLLAGKTLREM